MILSIAYLYKYLSFFSFRINSPLILFLMFFNNDYHFTLFSICSLAYFWTIYRMTEINLLFFSRPLLMFNSSSEMSVCITFSRIPKCLHPLPFCVAVDASVRHPVPENEPTKVLLRSFILNINDFVLSWYSCLPFPFRLLFTFHFSFLSFFVYSFRFRVTSFL